MNNEVLDALQTLHRAVADLVAKGFVVDGELRLCKPASSGILHTTCHGQINGGAGTYVAKLEKGLGPVEMSVQSTRTMLVQEAETILAATQITRAKEEGYTGDVCVYCGSSQMIRSGTCSTCTSCGSTSGCG